MKKLIKIAFTFLPFLASAQDTYTLKFLPQLQQSQWLNSSNQTDAKLTIGLPGISSLSFYIFNSGFTYHDIFHANEDGTNSLNFGALFNKLQEQNYVSFGASASLFSLNIAKDNFTAGFSINDRANFQANYSGDLFRMLWYGNGHYLNQPPMQIGNFGVNATWYREFAFHFTYNKDKWTFGMSPKILFGKTNINTLQTSILLKTNPNTYDLTATAKFDVKMSGISDSNDDKKGGYFNNGYNTAMYILNAQNPGVAIDFGAKYDVNEKLNVSFGVNSIGRIHWTSQVHNYEAGPSDYTFSGLNAAGYLTGDTTILTSKSFRDSINHLVKFTKNSDNYYTYLPWDMFILANYKLKHHWFGLQLSATRFNNDFIYAGTLCYQLKFGKHFTGALTYTLKNYSTFNVGGAIILQFAHMQFYLATDNWWAAVVPLDSKNTNFNLGMNIVAGRKVKKQIKDNENPIDVVPSN